MAKERASKKVKKTPKKAERKTSKSAPRKAKSKKTARRGKTAARRSARRAASAVARVRLSGAGGKAEKPVGVVTHYYGGIKVVIAKFDRPVKVGTMIRVKGATTDFLETVASMEFNHAQIAAAEKGQEVGIKVGGKAREGDKIYLA